MAGAILGEGQVSIFVTGAVLGEGHVSIFVTGAVRGEGPVSLFVTGAVLGEGQVSLFVTGAVFGEGEVSLSWQAQYLVEFGKIAGARNVVFFDRKYSPGARKVTLFARQVAD